MYSLLLALAAVIVATKLLGELSRRLGQPSVLGELLAGVILGGSALGLLNPNDPVISALAQLGLFMLIFQIGAHTDLRSLRRVGSSALTVAVAGVVLPFIGGFVVTRAFEFSVLTSVIGGASLTATSMAISARVLREKGVLNTTEGQVVMGAALADDVLGLIVLSVVVAVVGGASVSLGGVAKISAVSIGFIVAALAIGSYAIPPLFRRLDTVHTKGSVGMLGVALGMVLAAIALAGGAAMILGAFAAGVILHPTPQRHEIERTASQIGHFFVPIFFAAVGASVNLRALASTTALGIGAALIVVACLGKIAAGFAPWKFQGNKMLVGVAMVPRGEVGLIFAQMGLSTGAITPELFGGIMLMVVVTTFVSAPLLDAVIRRDHEIEREHSLEPEALAPGGRRQTTAGRRH
ncbi:MAG TPA: cation:proton antiporter [Gemmatimonadaceae bacterium]|nr:cation:proton antiporter [Gemmatimonadaceae bacterium]